MLLYGLKFCDIFGPARSSWWTSSDDPYPKNDECNPGPALLADVLMEPYDREQDHDHVADGRRRQNIAEIGKRQRTHVTGHANDQRNDSENDEGVGEDGKYSGDMMNINGPGALHAARKESVSQRAEDHNLENDEILTSGQASSPVAGIGS